MSEKMTVRQFLGWRHNVGNRVVKTLGFFKSHILCRHCIVSFALSRHWEHCRRVVQMLWATKCKTASLWRPWLFPHSDMTHMNIPKSEEHCPNSGGRDHPRSTWKQHYSPLSNKSAVWKYCLVLEKSANWLLSRQQHRLLCFISVRLKRKAHWNSTLMFCQERRWLKPVMSCCFLYGQKAEKERGATPFCNWLC